LAFRMSLGLKSSIEIEKIKFDINKEAFTTIIRHLC